MGEPLTASASAAPRPLRRGGRWRAALPFALAWSFAAATLNASLAPATVDQPRLEPSPPGAAPPPATHKNDLDFDSSELISV